MHNLYRETLLDQNKLEQVMEREYKKMYESTDAYGIKAGKASAASNSTSESKS